jgi:SAM-dependent methyltransferase/predicted transcriptional regulator
MIFALHVAKPFFSKEVEYASRDPKRANEKGKNDSSKPLPTYTLGVNSHHPERNLAQMAAPTNVTNPTPEKIFNTLNAYQQTASLKAAIELDIFTAIADGAQNAKAIARQVNASEKGVRVLCDFLVIHGFLDKEAGTYRLTEESAAFLSKRSPAYLGAVIGFLARDWQSDCFAKLGDVVRKGGSLSADGDNTKPNDEAWVPFARSMAPMMVPSANFIAALTDAKAGKPVKVLDVAAGHGMFGVTLAKENPNAQVIALDWPAVLEVAKENAQKHGVATRYALRSGSAFETEFGTGYDFILLTNIFHHFDIPTCEALIGRVYAALKPGGKAITLEFVPNEDRVSPPTAAAFSLIMLANTHAGDAYTLAEYRSMFAKCGFLTTTSHPVPGLPETVLISEKAG